jgi:cyclase
MKKVGLFILLFTGIVMYSECQINPDSVKVAVKQMSPGICLIEMYGCNFIISTGNDGTVLVDAGYAELAAKLKSEILKIDSKPIRYVINSHWHFDHVGGNLLFGKESTIIAHDTTRILLSQDKILLGEKIKAHPADVLPQITLKDKLTLYFNSDTIDIIAMEGGHTGSDIIVSFRKAGILHIGDIIFADMFPFCDVENGGNVLKIADNIQKIISEFPSDIKIIPGHGRIYSIEDLKKYKNMVTSTYSLVLKEVKKKKTLDEIKKEDVLKEWNEWAVAFSCNDWIDYIYYSIKRNTGAR